MKQLVTLAIALAAIMSLSAAITRPPKSAATKTEVVKPDLDEIRRSTLDPASKHYYPDLMRRYQRNETVMTAEQYRYLYLGYMFQEDYNPYRLTSYPPHVQALYDSDKEFKRAELDTIIKYAQIALDDNPFDLQQMNRLIYAYEKKGKVNIANIWKFRLRHIIAAIHSTGTGRDKDNAWMVINPLHVYTLFSSDKTTIESDQFDPEGYDIVNVRPAGAKNATTYYFNFKPLLEEYYRKYPEG